MDKVLLIGFQTHPSYIFRLGAILNSQKHGERLWAKPTPKRSQEELRP
jgi:hypothetical protein